MRLEQRVDFQPELLNRNFFLFHDLVEMWHFALQKGRSLLPGTSQQTTLVLIPGSQDDFSKCTRR